MKSFTYPAGWRILATRNCTLLIGLILTISPCVLAAEPNVQWVARYDSSWDEARALKLDGSGNVYVTGCSNGDYATVKYSAVGNQLWVARYNGRLGGPNFVHALAVDNSGNVYVTGTSYTSHTYNNYDYATVKYSPDGNQLWAASYNGPGDRDDSANALAVDNSGNVYVTGASWGDFNTQKIDYATIKYSPDGNQLWVKRYNGPGNNDDSANALALDGSANVYVTGYSYGSGTNTDFATIKYNTDGNQLWVSRCNGPGNTYDSACAIAIDGSGNVYVTGDSNGNYITIKYNTDGNQIWLASYSGPANNWDSPSALVIDSSRNVYVTGISYDSNGYTDYATVKYNSDGNQLWAARYNGPANFSDMARSLVVDNSGNVYVTGQSDNNSFGSDYATVKYDPNGNKLWAAIYSQSGDSNDGAYAVAVDNSGNVYVTGQSDNGGADSNHDYATIKYTQQPISNIIYVDANVTGGANNGSSWANAYKYLQNALTAAEPNYEIWVAQGTYRPDRDSAHPGGTGRRTATFQLKNGVAIYGGFPTGGDNWSSRDPNTYQTILSGDLAGNDVYVSDPCNLLNEPTRAENSYCVVNGSDTDATAILDGFTIKAGIGNGMLNREANCIVNNCMFVENSSGNVGGAMYNQLSDLHISNCIFFRNAAELGGGGINFDLSNHPVVANCSFISNKGCGAGNNAGGLYNNGSSPEVINCSFINNSAMYGGGVSNIMGSSPTLTNCTFIGNSALDAGGMNVYYSSPTLTNCSFSGNSALIGGGGMCVGTNCYVLLTDCNFSGNSAQAGGGMSTWDTGVVNVGAGGSVSTSDEFLIADNTQIRGTGSIVIGLGGEMIIDSNAIVDLSDPCDPDLRGTIHCGGLLQVKEDATLRNTDVNISRQVDGYFGKFKVEDSAQATNLNIYTDGDRFMDVDPCTFTGTIADNRIYVTITEGQNRTQAGILEVRGRDFSVSPCPNEPACQIDDVNMPSFDTGSWTLERLELAPGARLNLVDRFDCGNGSPEVLYVKNLVLGADSNLNYGFEHLYYTNLYGDSNSIIKGALLGFSLNDVNVDSNEEFENRVTNNNYINPEDPNSNKIYVERVVGLEPEPNGMMKMSNIEDACGQTVSARVKGEFAPCIEDEIRIRLNYLFTTTDPNVEIVIYLSDIPELGDLNDAYHYKEVARIPNPPVPRPGSVGSGQFGNFEMFVSTFGLDLTKGTWIELVLIEPQSRLSKYGGGNPPLANEGEHAVVFTAGWGAGVYCYYGICLDLDWSGEPDIGDFLTVISGNGRTEPSCMDGSFSSDGYEDSYDDISWDWALNLDGRKNMCITVPMHGSMTGFPAGGGFWHFDRPLNLVNLSGLNDLLISGKRGSADGPTKMIDRIYIFDTNFHDLNYSAPARENRNIRVVRGVGDDLYQINSKDGISRLDNNAPVVPCRETNCVSEPRYSRYAKVYVGIQGTGDNSFGRPIFDAAFDTNDANYIYVVPVVVAPAGDVPYDENLPYAAAAKLRLFPGQNPPYQLVKIYDGNILPGDNQRQYRNNLREIELDGVGNIYVTNANAFNASSILWKFEPSGAMVRRLDLDPCDPCKPHVRGPTGMCVSGTTNVLYLASSLYNSTDPNSEVIYGFCTADFNLVRTITVHKMQLVTAITEDPVTRTLWIAGYDMNCVIPEHPSPIASPFYDPYLAKVPLGANDVNAVCILDANHPGYDLAMPLSIVWTGSRQAQEKCGGADLNGNGTVNLLDLAILARNWLHTGCGCEGADLEPQLYPDGDVDIRDFDVMADHWLNTGCQ